MALSQIQPFDCSSYLHRLSDVPDWIADHIQETKINGRTGWREHFEKYTYSRCVSLGHQPLWLEGVQKRAHFTRQLTSNLNDDVALMKVVNEIMDWGRMRQYPPEFAPAIRKALNVLQTRGGNSTWTPQQMSELDTGGTIASMSKVFAMFSPHEWTIYDSRVATALACLVRNFWGEASKGEEVNANLLRFPVPPPRGESRQRPKGFPAVIYGKQGSLAFIYASWLQRRVAEILRTNSNKYGCPPTTERAANIAPLDADWQVYHVEMALWMMGAEKF